MNTGPRATDGGGEGRAPRAPAPEDSVPEDYVFEAAGGDGSPTAVRVSELFGAGKDSLVVEATEGTLHHRRSTTPVAA